ncbi:nuclear transport factor 2 family protein [Vineibacter terrae]|uniref:Nuclear transport factor 2 family protein n=1 Tax=Vineibacter terrae TaxID=2586908 RepID=A0A5C8PV74_9HYPH|nr:nuclear transport factor 2 family protein [Vineibacter terrae]TXL81961.1 nuclear transport factor 2 family protein [Vineibacter terrae]
MSDFSDLVDRYIAIWNETDTTRRRALIARTWTEGASYLDPMMKSDGHAGIDAMIAAVQEKFPGHRFSLAGKVDAYQDRVRFSWALAPEGGDALVKGTDFAVVDSGRLQQVTGFLDQVPAGAA